MWDTPLGFLERTVDWYRRLQPRVATDLLVYTSEEMERMRHTIPTRYPNGLPDSIPARVYTQPVAEETVRMADLLLDLCEKSCSTSLVSDAGRGSLA